MNIGRIESGSVVEYPIAESVLRNRFPSLLLPAKLTPECMPDGYILATDSPPPSFNRWQRIAETKPRLVDGAWVQCWEVLDLPRSLDDKVAEICGEIDARARRLRDFGIAGVSQAEISAWPHKLDEARALAAGGDAPSLSVEAAARGITVQDLAALVIAKHEDFMVREARIAGRQSALKAAARACTVDSQLLLLQIDDGWPE